MISHHTQEETEAHKTSNMGKHPWEQQEEPLEPCSLFHCRAGDGPT